ncbi:LOW QUALITY PROTEIN: CD226 antigen [Amazona ochrocephala]
MCALTIIEGKFVDSMVKLTVKVKLEFIYPKKAMKIQASWIKFNVTHKENIAVLHPIYGIHIEDTYNGRISFGNTSSEDKSLSFIKSTLQNVDIYFCSIITYPDGIEKVIEIVLPANIFGESQKQNNLVFNKPGENVAFTCPYEIGDSVLQVMWERSKADQVDIIVLCSSSGKQSFGSDFKERTLVDCSDANSKTVIPNIAASDFATYRCVATARNKTHVMIFTMAAPTMIFTAADEKQVTTCPVIEGYLCPSELGGDSSTFVPQKTEDEATVGGEDDQATWDHKWFIISIAGGISAAVIFSTDLHHHCLSQKPGNSYGSSNFPGTWNTGRREESSLEQTEI